MLIDFESKREVRSSEDFSKLYEAAWDDRDHAERLTVAYRALLAADKGRSADYLRERTKLEAFDWGEVLDGAPAFFRLDSGQGVGWSDVLEALLSVEALAFAYQVEESAWDVIRPGSTATKRVQDSLFRFECKLMEGEEIDGGGCQSAFMAMIWHRVRHAIATGAKDQRLISHMIAFVPEVRPAIEAGFAAREALEIEQALARGREAPEAARVGRSDHWL